MRLKKAIEFCFVATFIFAAQQLFAQSWQTYGSSADGDWEIDLARVTEEKGLVHYWVRHVTPSGLFTNGKEVISSYAANCPQKQIAITSNVEREIGGKVLKQGTLAPNLWQFQSVVPGSLADSALGLVCNTSTSKPTKPSMLAARVPNPPDWHFVAADSQGSYKLSVSPATILRSSDGLVTAVVSSAYATNQKSQNGSLYLYHLFEVVVNCKNQTLDSLRQEFISAEYGVTDAYDKKVDNASLKSVQSGSALELAVTYICGQASATSNVEKKNEAEKEVVYGSGTGWVVANGKIATAYHVVSGVDVIIVYGPDKAPHEATIAFKDEPNDIAILSVKFDKWRPASLPISRIAPRLGSKVFTIGFPHGDVLGLAPKFSSGEISANSGLQDDPRFFQISVPVQSGNSGGPLVNQRGEVVGIVTSKLDALQMAKATGDLPQNVNYAIKGRYLQGLLDDLGVAWQGNSGSESESNLEVLAAKIMPSVVLIVTAKK